MGQWDTCDNVGDRSNDLGREDFLLLAEVVDIYNAGDYSADAIEEMHDLLAASLDVEKKFTGNRESESLQAFLSHMRRAA